MTDVHHIHGDKISNDWDQWNCGFFTEIKVYYTLLPNFTHNVITSAVCTTQMSLAFFLLCIFLLHNSTKESIFPIHETHSSLKNINLGHCDLVEGHSYRDCQKVWYCIRNIRLKIPHVFVVLCQYFFIRHPDWTWK